MVEQRKAGRGSIFRSWLLPGCLLAVLVPGSAPAPVSPPWPPATGCAADVGIPLHLRLLPEGTMRPGAPLGVRLEVVADRPVDDLRVGVRAPAAVRVLASPASRWGQARAREVRSGSMTLLVPADGRRRTVDVVVEGTVNGVRLRRGASLNLLPGREPFRIVTEPDGRRVREVKARRIG
jgi:hypothetical protein